MFVAVDVHDIRMVFVKARERTNAVRRKEFILIEHELQNPRKLFLTDDGEQLPYLTVGAAA